MDRKVPDRGSVVFGVTTASLVLASFFVGARIICRHWIVRNVTWDDKVMVLAWIIAFFLSFTIDLGVANGLGKHDKDISGDGWAVLRRCEYVFSILYNPALMATKTSVLILYLRLAKRTQEGLRYASWATMMVVNVAGVVLTFMNIFLCRPVSAAWAVVVHENGSCMPLLTVFICAAPVNVITDLAILVAPIPVLTRAHLPSRQKTILVITFAFGVFVTIVDVVRIYYLQMAITEVATGGSSTYSTRITEQTDFAWDASLSLMWSAVEVNVGIACACVPTLKPLVLKLFPRLLFNSIGTSTSNGSKSPTWPSGLRSRSQTTASAALPLADGSGVYFFAGLTKPKNMLMAKTAESFKFCTIVSILFFLWGLSYGLLNNLNNAVAALNNMSTAKTLGLTSAYLGGGYFFGPLLLGLWILRRDEHHCSESHENYAENIGGFKATFIVGLCIYGLGTIIFWPSAITNSYGGFMLSNFVVGFGLSVLEVGANSFMVLCGPLQYGETRLLLAQGIQGVGCVVGSLLAQKVFFRDLAKKNSPANMTLINVQWTYLGVTLLCVVLGLFFFYMPLPEVSDRELEQSGSRLPVNPKKKNIAGLQLRTVSLVLAVFAQYMYVGVQQANIIYFRDFLMSASSNRNKSGRDAATGTTADPDKPSGFAISTSDYQLVGHTVFSVSRFLVGYLAYLSVTHACLPQPRTYLALSVALCFFFALLPVVLHQSNSNQLAIPAILAFFSEGPIWPLLFSLGLRGQGRRTKRAAAFITMGGSGGALFPFVMYGIVTNGGTVQTAFIVIVALTVTMAVYPVFLKFSGDAKQLVDPCPDVRSGSQLGQSSEPSPPF